MRIQNILLAMLVFLACMTALTNIARDLENEWGVTDAELNNGTGNVTDIINTFNYDKFNTEHQIVINATQYAPGGTAAEQPDSTLGQQAAITASSLMMAYKFASQAWTLPKLIITKMGGYFDIDPIWLNTLIMWVVIVVAFILASAIFYNKL